MRIIVFLDDNKNTLPFYSSGTMETYQYVEDSWLKINQFQIDLSQQNNLKTIQNNVNLFLSQVNRGNILVVKSIMGLANALLSEHGMGIWTFDGFFLIDLLSQIKKEVDKACKETDCNNRSPVLKGSIQELTYEINLKEVLSSNPKLNSMDILVPFIKSTHFKKLEIVCNHPPKWLMKTKDDLQLNIITEEQINGLIKATVFPHTYSPDISFRHSVFIPGQGQCSSGGC